jgi:lysophospholipase L1-like esterase
VGVAGVFGIVTALDGVSPWLKTGAPTIQKMNDLADNAIPSSSNFDCDNITARYAGTGIMHNECVVSTPLGLASGNGVTFAGTSQSVPIVPPAPFTGLNPIPEQEMSYTYTSGPVMGLYMGIYRTIRDKMKPDPDNVNGAQKYLLTKGPDFMLSDASGRAVPVNGAAQAFSPNGSWMVVDLPNYGFVRINLATFDMQPFAVSMNTPGDYSSYKAQITITNDGNFVAVQPRSLPELDVYDLRTCTSTALPVSSTSSTGCKSRNYWSDLTSGIPNYKAIYAPRFTNDSQLSFTAMHDYDGGLFKVSQYTLTAPGENPTGIEYLGMGDSYASGQGAFDYLEDTDTANNSCHLSSRSYPMMLSAALFNSGHSVACSGAVMRDVTDTNSNYKGQVKDGIKKIDRGNIPQILNNFSPGYIAQIEFVQKYNPQAITVSIGGNDILFADIVKQCISMKTCYSTYEDQQELANRITGIGQNLQDTYKALSGPGRRIYVIGYPQIVATNGSCADNVRLNAQEIQMFNDLTAMLNQTIRNAAAAAGVQYVDVADALLGHRLCETKSSNVAVNGVTSGGDLGLGPLKFIGAETYHPNALGHQLLMQAILSRTNNLRNPNPATTTSTTTAPSSFPYGTAPKTGRAINSLVGDAGLAPDTLVQGSSTPLTVDPSIAILHSSAPYVAKLDDGPPIGTAITNALGQLSGSVTLPPATACGYHVLHLYGPNILNQSTDIYKLIFVQSTSSDCDGNGMPDNTQPCGLLAPTGNDVDMDGIDDGCDPVIGDIPVGPLQKVYLLQSSIHAVRP